MFKKIAVLILAVFLGSFAYAQNSNENLEEFFSTEAKKANEPIIIVEAIAYISSPKGEYKLYDYSIETYNKDKKIYILHMKMEKREGPTTFYREYDIPFWYNGRRIVFKTYRGKKSFELPEDKIVIKKDSKENIEVIQNQKEYRVRIPIPMGEMEMLIQKQRVN
ncbi:hypothetical protein [Nitrosophilus kaiyonis]|uniref:hypothetical protein n=1 Tax=Nitrosophilus kaiyonis TaxID=2930200 RepID=UPI002491101E|nr:hypothetical protein [Nitrosophilus kaiyonis]